jgi:hypothetical protein
MNWLYFSWLPIQNQTTSSPKVLSIEVYPDRMVNFPAALIIRHTIDEQSALFGVTPERLEKEDAFCIASILSLELVMAAPTKQSQCRGQ